MIICGNIFKKDRNIIFTLFQGIVGILPELSTLSIIQLRYPYFAKKIIKFAQLINIAGKRDVTNL